MYSAKSSRGASKSGDIQCLVSFADPGWHGQLVRGGRMTMAIGSPPAVKTSSSPGTIPSTSSRRWPCAASNGRVRDMALLLEIFQIPFIFLHNDQLPHRV